MIRINTLVFALLITACIPDFGKKEEKTISKKGLRNGIVTSKFADGSTRAEIPYVDGKKSGKAKEYYQGGSIFMEIDYVNNIKHGSAKRYWQNGIIYQETPYDSGLIHGIQRKYRENGKLSAEIKYFKDQQCIGIKEYLLDGSPKTDYPKIVITPQDNLWRDNEYVIQLKMSDKSRNVEFYTGELTDGQYIGSKARPLWTTDKFGVGEIKYMLPPGGFLMEELNIIAKVKTVQGNFYITQKKYNVAIENKR